METVQEAARQSQLVSHGYVAYSPLSHWGQLPSGSGAETSSCREAYEFPDVLATGAGGH